MPTTTPVITPVKTPTIEPEPNRRLSPERICPSQKERVGDGVEKELDI